MDNAGVIYISDTDTQTISTIDPEGTVRELVTSPELLWIDAMWIDDDHLLWMPSAQLNRIPTFSGGDDRTTPPFRLYTIPVPRGRSQ